MNRVGMGITLLVGLGAAGCLSGINEPLEVVDYVDLERYAGKWYEIAKYPVVFEAGCTGVTAEYTLQDDGTVEVINRCRQGALDGPERTIEGTARLVDDTTNAKLAVRFFGPFEGPYWIIDLDTEDYQWAVVGDPSRTTLWILSRTPQMDDALYDAIVSRLPDKGYDPLRLEPMLQPDEAD